MSKAIDPSVYRAILRVKSAYVFDGAALLMRFYTYMMNIGTITMLTLSGYSFLSAGLVSSLIALSTFLISPRISKLIDERGQHVIIPWAALVTVGGLTVMLLCVALRGPEWLLFVAAVPMGFAPNPQALPRARWTYLIRTGKLGDAAPDLRTMFSYEGVLDDAAFMFSPAISIALATTITPIAGLLAGGIGFLVGSVVMICARSTEPIPGWGSTTGEGLEGDEGETFLGEIADDGVSQNRSSNDAVATAQRQKSIFRTSTVVRILFVLTFLLGAFFGIFDTSTVALAEEIGDPTFASVVLMASSFASMIMGFIFGMLRLNAPQYKQLIAIAVMIGLMYGCMIFIETPEMLFIVSIVGALFYAPYLIVLNASCECAVPGKRLTEAITWMNAGGTCGLALGPTLGGFLIDLSGATFAFDLGGIIALAIPVVVLVFAKTLKRDIRNNHLA